jgi:SAM-dependent methyltransferase
MPRWHQGYVSDIDYTTGFIREATPAWLHFVALLLGHRAPAPSGRLRVADLGCGHGVTAAVIAAASPDTEVWGFDFNPRHIDSARRLASAAGLDNLHFEERAFADLAASPIGAWPEFDIVTLHGVWSWISPESCRHVTAFLDRFLRPGGLAYVSYNTLAGWASMLPVQRMMHWMAKSEPGRSDEAVRSVLAFVGQLREGHAAFFTQNPMAGARLDPAATVDARYLAHEYLHAQWNPMAVADVAAELAGAKCAYLGSATLPDNLLEVSVPAALVPVVNAIRDPIMREMAADLACARPFRRDIYHRGAGALTAREAQTQLDLTAIVGLGHRPGGELTFDCALGKMTGRPEVYDLLLERLLDGPLTIGEAHALPMFSNGPKNDVLQAFALLVSSARAHPVLATPSDGAASRRLNAAIIGLNAGGADIPWLAAPLVGTAIQIDVVETLVVGEMRAGRAADVAALTDAVFRILQASGRSVQREGAPIGDETAARRAIGDAVAVTLSRRVGLFQRLGILEG